MNDISDTQQGRFIAICDEGFRRSEIIIGLEHLGFSALGWLTVGKMTRENTDVHICESMNDAEKAILKCSEEKTNITAVFFNWPYGNAQGLTTLPKSFNIVFDALKNNPDSILYVISPADQLIKDYILNNIKDPEKYDSRINTSIFSDFNVLNRVGGTGEKIGDIVSVIVLSPPKVMGPKLKTRCNLG